MKRLLLLLSAMLVMGGMTAQDIYTAGYYQTDGRTSAGVYKNGNNIYYVSGSDTYHHRSSSVIVKDGDCYWVDNATNVSNNSDVYGDVFKNSTRYLNNSTGTHVNALFYGNFVFAVGSKRINDVRTAVLWRGDNNTPYYTLGDGNDTSDATCGTLFNSSSYVGGYQFTSATEYVGKVWKNGSVLYTFPSKTKILDIAVVDGTVYTVGTCNEDGAYKLKVWSNTTAIYTLVSANASERASISVDAGDVYVTAYSGNGPDCLWKNGEEVYNTSGYFYAVTANSSGVYYAGGLSQGAIWKDGTLLYSPTNSLRLVDIYMDEPTCANSDIRTLPYTESFETGMTDWTCWTKVDSGDNGEYSSYWKRAGKRVLSSIPDGDYCAAHKYGPSGVAQTGWLISPRLFLQPGRDNTTLSFKSCENSTGTTNMTVLVSTTNTNTSAFTEVYSLTNQSDTWKTITVDLKAYQGQAIYIAFKYEGTWAKNWFIDDIQVTEEWEIPAPRPVPYIMNFSGSNPNQLEPGYLWYNIDLDHSGDGRCWKYNSSEQCAWHPYGQQNTPQQGAMFTPYLNLPSGMNYSLSFRTKTTSDGDNMAEKVGIIIDPNTNYVPDYTAVTWLWQETSYSSSWVTRTIDLTPYAGHIVSICFWYEGTWARNWYIDDVEVTNALPQYNINVVANNASWGTVTGGNTYDQGATATITATPNSGYDFLKWTKNGSDVSTNPTYSFTVTENATYTAVFGEQAVTYYTITTAVNPTGAGTVTGGNTYAAGATATLTASANTGWEFTQWQDGNTSNPRTITVTGDATYTAQFSQINYTISVLASPAEGGTVTGGGNNYHYGDAVELTATANAGYDFINWNDGETNPMRTIIVDGDADYVAYFAEQGATTYEITVLSNNLDLGTVEGGGVFPEGSVITISAHPFEFARFVSWNDGNTETSRDITVTNNATYIATFNIDAVNENEAQAITLYPNPANDVIRLEGLDENSEVRIYNVIGELVKVVNVSENEEINVSDLSSGLYIVRSGNATLKFTKK